MTEAACASCEESEAMATMKRCVANFETEKGRLQGLSFVPGPLDVAIATTAKAGTTWLQQICHQLRSAGDEEASMNFEEITQVVPWLELAYDIGIDLHAPQCGVGEPRFFKTHAWAGHCPVFPKTIVCIRDPYDVLLSFYHFVQGWIFEGDSISLDSYANMMLSQRGIPENRMQKASYFSHLTSWYERRHEPGVLFLCYEDLKQDLKGQVLRIAQFVSTEQHDFTRPEVVQWAVDRSTFSFMKAHGDRFDDRLVKRARNVPCGLPPEAGVNKSKVQRGQAGLGKAAFSEQVISKVQKQWKEVVEPVTGCKDYQELRNKLSNEEKVKAIPKKV